MAKIDIDPGYTAIGVDPGLNFGLAFVSGGHVLVYNGRILRTDRYSPYLDVRDFMTEWWSDHVNYTAVIEGASYGEKFGQVGLAEIRIGFASCFLPHCVHIVPPSTARRVVLGHGNLDGASVWPDLNHNAADSVVLALVPYYDSLQNKT